MSEGKVNGERKTKTESILVNGSVLGVGGRVESSSPLSVSSFALARKFHSVILHQKQPEE